MAITPDLAAGLCVGGRAGLEPDAWLTGDAELRQLALRTCGLCPVLDACASWAQTLPELRRCDAVLGGHWYGISGRRTGEQQAQRDQWQQERQERAREQQQARREQVQRREQERREQRELGRQQVQRREQERREQVQRREQERSAHAIAARLAVTSAVAQTPRERAAAELLRDPERSNRLIAAAAQAGHTTVRYARRELETAGVITCYRAPSQERSRRERATAELLADPERSNRAVAVLAGADRTTVCQIRHELEDDGVITCYRGTAGAERRRQTAAPAGG